MQQELIQQPVETIILNLKINLRVEQGYEIGRPSLLLLKAQNKEGKIEVSVGGKVIMVAKREFV